MSVLSGCLVYLGMRNGSAEWWMWVSDWVSGVT